MSTASEEKKVSPRGAASTKKEAVSNMFEIYKRGDVVQMNPSKEQDPPSNTFDGRIVSITGNKLVMSNKEGKEYSKTVATEANLTCDGTACKAEDLKAGHKIRVTTNKDDRSVATGIESLNKNADFAKCS